MTDTTWGHLANTRPAGASAGRPNAAQTVRNALWCELYESGASSCQIAEQYGVSRERVCQILRRFNLIARKDQRRELAKEEIEADRLTVKAARAELERNVVALVSAGSSMPGAAAKMGITTPIAALICRKHGVKSNHGKWRDFEPRKARLRELIAAGETLTTAREIAGREEGKVIGYTWVHHNCPELCDRQRGVKAPKPPRSVTVREAKSIEPPSDVWTEERTAELIRLWFGGTSAQQVADIFGAGFTRNMIIGKIHRLRLAGLLKA